ncbi:MAG: hypothetical protein PVI19_13280 [Syntrophobacterales bacterium]
MLIRHDFCYSAELLKRSALLFHESGCDFASTADGGLVGLAVGGAALSVSDVFLASAHKTRPKMIVRTKIMIVASIPVFIASPISLSFL